MTKKLLVAALTAAFTPMLVVERSRTRDAAAPTPTKPKGQSTSAPAPEAAEKPTASTALAAPASTAVGQVMDFSADSGAGMEGVDKDSLAIPFLVVLQSNSPQCQPVKDGGIDGAKTGMFYNSVTKELLETVQVIPVAFQRRFIEWAKREAGGGFKGEHAVIAVEGGPEAPNAVKWAMKEYKGGNVMTTEDDHLLKDTRSHFVLMQTSGGNWLPAIISLSSTQIKKSKLWNSRMQSIELTDAKGKKFVPPSFSHIYKCTTVGESNDKGQWQGIVIDLVGQVEDASVYNQAKAFHSQVQAGKVKADTPMQDGDDAPATGDKF